MKVDLVGINKTFGMVCANDNISLNIPAGTIQGVLGENGAGKSTLMKVLSGYISADSGQIILDDHEALIHSPEDAIRMGIGMLHQDPLDFPPMKVVDNFLVGSKDTNPWYQLFPNKTSAIKEFDQLKSQFQFDVDPLAYVDTLTVGERQQIEILRLLYLGVKVLILDEPTTGISANQKEKLFAALKLLADSGKTILFVSHKLEDVEQLCHRVAVLRQGKLTGESSQPFDPPELIKLMFGKPITKSKHHPQSLGSTRIELKNISIEYRQMRIHDVNLEVDEGEVIGLAGMEGSGQLTLLRACAGLIRPVAGEIRLNNQVMTGKNYLDFKQAGVAYLPASRMEEGLVPGLTLSEHFTLTGDMHGLFIDQEKTKSITQAKIEEFNIRGKSQSKVESLSGGNQQRALLALMDNSRSLILMEHPTRGLDVESSIYIWGKLNERCRQGSAILFISSDLEELLDYSNRILVFFSGKVSAPLNSNEITSEQLGQLIGGKGFSS